MTIKIFSPHLPPSNITDGVIPKTASNFYLDAFPFIQFIALSAPSQQASITEDRVTIALIAVIAIAWIYQVLANYTIPILYWRRQLL